MATQPGAAGRMVLVLAAVLCLALTAVPAAQAQPSLPPCPTPGDPLGDGPVVVQGWVINHRELPVDATRIPEGLQVDAINSTGARVRAAVAGDGFFKLTLQPDVWNFEMQLPVDWDGIVPLAPRGGLAVTGCTPLAGRSSAYIVVFKIRRLIDVTVRKWEETATGAVQPGAGWQVTFQPIGDPFAVKQTRQTGGDGTASVALTPGTWLIAEHNRPGWSPVTPSQVTIRLDPYASSDAENLVVFKNRHR